ncbi:hypothetical protein [uncultured Brevundimonas sp.]|uniref:hypothetical protein n=1 Tax=Brevundimonas sp. CEF1 TaxID=3442642 RepID=UPI000FAD178E|nr:hypothetical protein [uncultured Brevundimonas sp.]
MRGQVLTFDSGTDEGAIAGDDGARYRFAGADVQSSSSPLEPGQRVDFVAGEDRQATEIFVMRPVMPDRDQNATGARRGQFDLGRVIQRTFTSISQNAVVFFGAAALLVGVPSVLAAFGQGDMLTTASGSSFLFVAFGTVLYLVGLYILQGVVVKAAVNGFHGKTTSFDSALGVGIQMFLPLLGLGIVAGLGMILGYFLLIVPGVMLTVLWSVAAPAVVVEKRGIMEGLQRSRDLTRGYRWPVFGLLVIYLVLSWIVGGAIGGLNLALGGSFDASPNLSLNLITTPIVNVLSGVVASAGVASLYYELRTAKEGAGPEDLASIFD